MITALVMKQAFSVHVELTYSSFFFFLTLQPHAIFSELKFFLIRPKFMYSILTSYMLTIL